MADLSKDTQTKSGSPAGRVPAYLELAGEIEARIRSGELRPGSQLPPQRDLARERSVNVSTVTRAYRELQNLNLVVGSTRRGTIVTSEGAMPRVDRAATPAGVIDLTVNRPAVDDFRERLAEALPNLAVDMRFREIAGVSAAGRTGMGAQGGAALDCAQRLRAGGRGRRRHQRRAACAAGSGQQPDRAGRCRRLRPADLLRAEGAGANVPLPDRRHRQRRARHVGRASWASVRQSE